MALLVQQTMFENTDGEPAPIHELSRTNLGTFQDSLRAPIHRWFTYPAGFSYKAVEETIRLYDMKPGMTIYDPFAGTATTNIVASEQGIHSFGVEAHPFVHFVGRTKLFWNFTFSDLRIEVDNLIKRIHQSIEADTTTRSTKDIFPELVLLPGLATISSAKCILLFYLLPYCFFVIRFNTKYSIVFYKQHEVITNFPLPLWKTYPYGIITFGRGQESPPELMRGSNPISWILLG